ncbi:MAG TPA: hypothetical protein VGQ16_08900 [Vicinamibacterales bacterium]|jgi:hypothetical protein|nr:hypothetical protein [Vicinamibacterales bacterium]
MRSAVNMPPASVDVVRTPMPIFRSSNASDRSPKTIAVDGITRRLRPATMMPSDEMPSMVPLISTGATAADI